MPKRKRKLTAAEKAAKKQRQKEYMTIFINGKQKRVKRPPTIDGMSVDEFIRANADPIWLLQHEMYELLDEMYDPRPDNTEPMDDEEPTWVDREEVWDDSEEDGAERSNPSNYPDDLPF